MSKKTILATGILFLLSACSVPHTNLDTNPAFSSHRYSSHDLEILWKSEKTDTGIRVDGTAKNVRTDSPYNALVLTAKLLDENGNVLAKGNHLFQGRLTGSEPFRMDIPLIQTDKVKRINFSYSYAIGEDNFQKDFDSTP